MSTIQEERHLSFSSFIKLMKNINKLHLFQLIPYIILGFSLLFIIYFYYYEKLTENAASNMYTENAEMMIINNRETHIIWEKFIDDNCIVYASSKSAYSNLKGVYAGNDISFPQQILSGFFFSKENFKNNDKVAIIGKGLINNTVQENNRRFLQIENDSYEIIGIIGFKSIPSSLDYNIYITMGNFETLLNDDLYYIFDGKKESIKNSTEKFKSIYDTQPYENQEVNLKTIYFNNNYSFYMYFYYFIIIILTLAIFVFFEIYKKHDLIYIYNINGASKLQIINLMLYKYIIIKYLALIIGSIIAWLTLLLVNKITFNMAPFIFALLINFFVLSFITIISVLNFLYSKEQFYYEAGNINIKFNLLKFSVLILFVGILLFANLITKSFQNQKNDYNSFKNLSDYNFYYITSPITSATFDEAYSSPYFLNRMKNVIQEFSSNEQYPFYECSNQYLFIKNTNFPDQFYYSDAADKMVSALQVSPLFFDLFKIKIQYGDGFAKEDYIGDNRIEIPVILGNAYKNIYSVGDRIKNVEYLFKNYTFLVVGIMEKNNYFIDDGNAVLMDYIMLMPSFTYLNDPAPNTNEYAHQFALYTQKLDGIFLLNKNNNFASLYSMVSQIVKKNGIYPLDFLTINRSSVYFLQCLNSEYINSSYLLLCMFLISLFILILKITDFLLETKKYLVDILLICGANLKQIIYKIFGELFALIFLANIIAFLITIMFFSLSYSIYMLIVSIILVSLIVLIYLLKKLNIKK